MNDFLTPEEQVLLKKKLYFYEYLKIKFLKYLG